MTHEVFISFAAADRATAETVCRALEAVSMPCWIAPRDVAAGTRYAEAIVDAIRESRVFVLIFSGAANASTHVEREVDRAASLGLPIVPLRIAQLEPRASLEYYLAGTHWLDAVAPPLDEPLARLIAAVGDLLGPHAASDGRAGLAQGREAGTREATPAQARLRQERRVITVLACELALRPALSQHADPEDADAALRAIGTVVRGVIEAHGGVLQTFTGQAVTAVFGLPALHEDDAERGVRAGLSLVEQAGGLAGGEARLGEVRVGVHTGEALVRLDDDAATDGNAPSGDLLAVAAHLYSLAPIAGVAVSESARALTAEAFEYEAVREGEALGAAGPVWLAKLRAGVRARDRRRDTRHPWSAVRPSSPSSVRSSTRPPVPRRRRSPWSSVSPASARPVCLPSWPATCVRAAIRSRGGRGAACRTATV